MSVLRRALVVCLVLQCGCGANRTREADRPVSVVDDLGRTVVLPRAASRVVSVIPSLTEIVVAIGARDALIARTRYDRHEELRSLPSVGGTTDVNLEAVLELRPHLVLVGDDSPLGDRFAALGLIVYRADVESLVDVQRHLANLGVLLDRRPEAIALRRRIDAGLDSVRSAVAGRPRPTVLYLIWDAPPQTAGRGTFLDDLITVAGGTNAFGDTGGAWPRLSMESIVHRDPDVLVASIPHDGSRANATWLNAPGWGELSAVRDDRILIVSADLFNRPGPRIAEAANELARFLHPDAFPARGEHP